MLCDDVKRVVYFFLDGSLGQQKVIEFQTHIQVCRDCDTRTQVHRRLRDFLRRRLRPVDAPEHLKVRLSHSIRVAAE